MGSYHTIQISPFTPSFAKEEVDRLLAKVRDARLPEHDLVTGSLVEGAEQWNNKDSWDRGPPVSWMKKMMERWRDEWSYSRFLERLQRWPQFKARIGDQDLHFIHAQTPHQPAKAVVVLLTGWPSNPYDFNEVIGPLIEHQFDVVCPSYPGSAFSSGPSGEDKSSFDDYADMLHGLLIEGLGYTHYALHGADWGHYTARAMANRYKKHCKAVHLSFLPAEPYPQVDGKPTTNGDLSKHELAVLERGKWWKQKHAAYYMLMCSNSQLLGLTLYDSPLALLSWIGEKWFICSDRREETAYTSDDYCLDWLTLIFLTGTALSCQLPYVSAASGNAVAARDPNQFIIQPTGFSSLPYEVMPTTLRGAKTSANIVYYKQQERGGHFSAAERPVEIAGDIVETLKAARLL